MIPRFVWKLIRNADFQDLPDLPSGDAFSVQSQGGIPTTPQQILPSFIQPEDYEAAAVPGSLTGATFDALAPGGGGDSLQPGGATPPPPTDTTPPATDGGTSTFSKTTDRAPGLPGPRDRQVPTRRQAGAAGGNPMQQILQMLFQAAGQGNPQAMNMLRSLMGGGGQGGMPGMGGMGGYMNPVMRTLAGMGRGPFGRFGRHGHGRFGGGGFGMGMPGMGGMGGMGGQFGGIQGLYPGQQAALAMMGQNADNAARQALLNQGRNPNTDTTYAQMKANIDTQMAAQAGQMINENLRTMSGIEQQNFANANQLATALRGLGSDLFKRGGGGQEGDQQSPGSFSPGTTTDTGATDTTDASAA